MLRRVYEDGAGRADAAGSEPLHGPREAACVAEVVPDSAAVIATRHLRLRPFALTQVSQLASTASASTDPCTGRAAAGAPLCRLFGADARRASRISRNCLHWAVSRLLDGRPVGYVSLHGILPELGYAQLSFWTGRGSARVAYASEAAQAVLAFAFSTLAMQQVCSFHLSRDRFAQQVLARLGMRPERGSAARREPDQADAVLASGITRADWLASL